MYMIWKCCNYVINYYLSLWYNNLKLTQCTYLRVYDCKIEFDKNMHIYIYTFMVFFFLRKHGEFHIRQSCLMKSKCTKMKFTERKYILIMKYHTIFYTAWMNINEKFRWFQRWRDCDITCKSRGKQGSKISKSRWTHLYVTIIKIGQCYSVFAIIENVLTYVCVYVHDDISKYYWFLYISLHTL